MNESFVLTLTFQTDQGKLFSFSISDPSTTLDAFEIKSAMLDIISSDVMISTAGSPAYPHSARMTKTEATELNVA